jgi:hypothetical protein
VEQRDPAVPKIVRRKRGDAGAVSTFTTESDEWQPGNVLYDQERVAWRVVRVLDVDPDELRPFGVLVVEPVG